MLWQNENRLARSRPFLEALAAIWIKPEGVFPVRPDCDPIFRENFITVGSHGQATGFIGEAQDLSVTQIFHPVQANRPAGGLAALFGQDGN